MRRLLSYLFFIFLSSNAFCQGPPVWYDSSLRELKYPRDMYFTGFAIGEKNPGESDEAALRRISDEAKIEAVSSIRMTVSKVMSSMASSSMITGHDGISEISIEDFSSSTTIQTGIKDIPGLVSEVWPDPKKRTIAAFAYVGKSELLRKIDRRLTVNMTKLELAVEEAQKLAGASRPKEASDAVNALSVLLADIEDDQKLLISIDGQYSDEDLQIQKFSELKRQLSAICDSLKDGVAVCLICSAEIFGNAYSDFEKELKAAMSGMQCHFVESREEAERVIEIKALAVEHSNSELYGLKNYFCYVNVDLMLENAAKGVRLYEGRVSQKGGHTCGYGEAAKDGYREILEKLMTIIKENLL
ncbi:MAG: hypothetical protein K2J62_03035 [Bacteroidales bacterium]|nr:hypothetical protein [Bacteroidales bacterium]